MPGNNNRNKDARARAARMQDEAEDRWEDLRDNMSEKWSDAKDMARDKAKQVQEYAEDNPWKMAAIGLVAGFILGSIVMRRRD